MPLVTLTTAQRALMQEALDTFNEVQQDGATVTGGTSDNVIASKATVDASAAVSPPAPLFLPLPPVPGGQQAQIFRQMSDNGQAAIYAALLKHVVVVTTRVAYGVTVNSGDAFVTLTGTGMFPHSTGPGIPGVPVDTAAPSNQVARYVEIVEQSNNQPVVDGSDRVFGYTRVGASTSPDSVEIVFYKAAVGTDPSASTAPFTWTGSQPTVVNLRYGFRQVVGDVDETAFRRVFL